MILSILIGAAAGYLAPKAEPHLKRFVEQVALKDVGWDPNEFDMLTVLVLAVAAGVFCMIFDINSSVISIGIGMILGLFGPRFYRAIMQKDVKPASPEDDE